MMRRNLIRLYYDPTYVESLKKDSKRGQRKAMAFLIHAHNYELGKFSSTRDCAKAWGVCNATAWTWSKEFDKELERIE